MATGVAGPGGDDRGRGARPRRSALCSAGLLGVAGVAFGALAAHVAVEPAAIERAGTLLGWHAAALVGLAFLPGRVAAVATAVLTAGAALFALGVGAHGFLAVRLPTVAPTGGTLLLLGWLLVAVAAVLPRR